MEEAKCKRRTENEGMEFERDKKEAVLVVDDDDGFASFYSSSSSMCQCRICHEEEEVGDATMENPCACSGTLKFAHRGCIQRWCDEKGSTFCEICLQNFEPGYTVAPKKALVDVGVTIRESLEVPRLEYEPPDSSDNEFITDFDQCSATSRRASCCRSVAVTFTVILLLRHLISVATLGADNYAFTLLIVIILRASGIVLPFYFIMKMISAMQRLQREHHLQEADDSLETGGNNNFQLQHHTIEIHS